MPNRRTESVPALERIAQGVSDSTKIILFTRPYWRGQQLTYIQGAPAVTKLVVRSEYAFYGRFSERTIMDCCDIITALTRAV
ncbi:hypothetical protein TNCT_467611 [Trichonephila clavata]|uniref:Uncharacterized protein n=1 Tax=Trichonephila clavata TaxID=2740835 RepID=A0A8X6GW44_TRICU|nr:hypothetical protein TNCT_467611 [Trichonephila clavata]